MKNRKKKIRIEKRSWGTSASVQTKTWIGWTQVVSYSVRGDFNQLLKKEVQRWTEEFDLTADDIEVDLSQEFIGKYLM